MRLSEQRLNAQDMPGELLEESKSAEEILQRLGELTSPFKEDIVKIGLRCNKGVSENRILCSITVNANAGKIASTIGGNFFGTMFLYRVIEPHKTDFRCVNRQNGKLQNLTCRCDSLLG